SPILSSGLVQKKNVNLNTQNMPITPNTPDIMQLGVEKPNLEEKKKAATSPFDISSLLTPTSLSGDSQKSVFEKSIFGNNLFSVGKQREERPNKREGPKIPQGKNAKTSSFDKNPLLSNLGV